MGGTNCFSLILGKYDMYELYESVTDACKHKSCVLSGSIAGTENICNVAFCGSSTPFHISRDDVYVLDS